MRCVFFCCEDEVENDWLFSGQGRGVKIRDFCYFYSIFRRGCGDYFGECVVIFRMSVGECR